MNMIFLIFLVASLSSIPWAGIFLVAALVLLAIAGFLNPPPLYSKFSYGWAGMFFLALSFAVSGL